MYCTRCGAENEDDAKFCEQCGEKFQNTVDNVIPAVLPDEYVEHGNVNVLRKEVKMDVDTITERIVAAFTHEEPKKES